jgi:diguanylate cyclase (GGDEF)-like protein/PAS domain S-box-containing protein
MSQRGRIILVGTSPFGPSESALGKCLNVLRVADLNGIRGQEDCAALLLAPDQAARAAECAAIVGENCPIIVLTKDPDPPMESAFVYRAIGLDGATAEDLADRIQFTVRAFAAEKERDLLRQVVQNASDCILTVEPGGRITLANQAVAVTFGCEPAQIIGASIEALFPPETPPGPVAEMLEALRSGGTWAGEAMARRRDGSRFPVHVSVSVARDPTGATSMAILHARDVTDQQRLLDRLKQLSITDDLTGAYNARYFWARLRYEFLRARRYNQPAACLMVDLDRFKMVNDTHGHRVGDDVLRLVTKTMNDGIRQVDIIARYGGEEFAVILPNTDLVGALPCAEHLRACVEAAVLEVDGQRLHITVSIGVAALAPEIEDEEQLLRNADEALIAAKRSGRNRVREWQPGMDASTDALPLDPPQA